MALSTFEELKTSIADWLQRSDLTAVIPDFIRLAEARFDRNEALQEERVDAITLGAATVALPSDCRIVQSLYLDDDTRQGGLEPTTPEWFAENEGRTGNLTGVPKYVATTTNGTSLLLSPAPDAAYTAQIVYLRTLDRLSASQTTNWLLDLAPDVYLFGALLMSAPYLRDPEAQQMWKEQLANAFAELKALQESRRFSLNTPVMRPKRRLGGANS